MKILFCNIGWMKHYQGQTDDDSIIGGGKFVYENGYGYEMKNFHPIDDYCYGYVHVRSRHLNLEKIENTKKVNENFIDHVCIVWIATKPKKGRFIVGWYKNAKVYREQQCLLDNDYKLDYWFKANKNDCILIPEEERNFPYPSGRGFMSTTPYTYAVPNIKDYTQNEIEVIQNYVQSVKNFINNYGKLPQEQIVLDEDRANIESSKESETTKTQLVNARLGQEEFRKNLLSLYPECLVTKVKLEALLKASHIKPWRDSDNNERLDKYNGFIFAAHVDALFDKGYISFDDDGNLLISDLCKDDIDKLNIDIDSKINIHEKSKKYLRWHRDYIYKK